MQDFPLIFASEFPSNVARLNFLFWYKKIVSIFLKCYWKYNLFNKVCFFLHSFLWYASCLLWVDMVYVISSLLGVPNSDEAWTNAWYIQNYLKFCSQLLIRLHFNVCTTLTLFPLCTTWGCCTSYCCLALSLRYLSTLVTFPVGTSIGTLHYTPPFLSEWLIPLFCLIIISLSLYGWP